jgi:hypothetical protein
MTNTDFLNGILSNPDFHIPIEANFVVGFNNLNAQTGILKNLSTNYTDIIPDKLDVNNHLKYWEQSKLNNDDIFFANSVTLPGETVTTSRAGFSSNGDGLYGSLLSGPILTGRSNTSNIDIMFLETNQSFVDYVIRPWVVAASHYGLTAKDTGSTQNFKTTITVNFLNKILVYGRSEIRKTFTFQKAVPVSVEGGTFSYGGNKANVRSIKTSWIYSTYEVS